MKKTLKVIGTGFAMGIADLIPGVSGGTIAFISGFYDQLVDAISAIDMQLIKLFFTGKRKQARTKIHGGFLVKLFGGVLGAIVLAAHAMSYLLETYPSYVKGFFFGVIIASAFVLIIPYKQLGTKYFIHGVIGIFLGILLTTLEVQLSGSYASLLPAGMVASVAMILPGISGSYILLILGKYEIVLGLVTEITSNLNNLPSLIGFSPLGAVRQIAIFIVGVLIGLIGFAKILHRLLKKYHTQTLFVLVGLMIGALPVIRPRSQHQGAHDGLILLRISAGIGLIGLLHVLQHKKNLNP